MMSSTLVLLAPEICRSLSCIISQNAGVGCDSSDRAQLCLHEIEKQPMETGMEKIRPAVTRARYRLGDRKSVRNPKNPVKWSCESRKADV